MSERWTPETTEWSDPKRQQATVCRCPGCTQARENRQMMRALGRRMREADEREVALMERESMAAQAEAAAQGMLTDALALSGEVEARAAAAGGLALWSGVISALGLAAALLASVPLVTRRAR